MRTLVVGAGTSGLAAARLARRLGHSVSIYDHQPERAADILGQGFGAAVGEWDVTTLSGVDLVVASPGVPERALPFTHANELGIPVWSEIEYAWREIAVPCVAVTGTNGKTTVTALVAEMLTESGLRAEALGNIGIPLSDAVGGDLEVAVIEVSSFQLRFTCDFRPQVAVVTNVAPDHLDWHGSLGAYREAKAKIVANQLPQDILIIDGDDEGAGLIAARAPGRVATVSAIGRGSAGGVEDGLLWMGDLALPLGELGVSDSAFLVDLALAGAAAIEIGANLSAVATVARRFKPGPHRRTVVADHQGVRYVDDSKATNPHAALAAVMAFPSVVLIAGGIAKGLDISPLARHPHVRYVVAIGEAADQLLAPGGAPGAKAASMDEAVAMARGEAAVGDTVLLAPGCASFDMFVSYGARGDAFSAAVSAMMDNDK